ncbi:MAG: DNA internalization-related competence protein ComEC/Rec2 [Burkholderiales bacterium]|jgi:competence protein ComEC|nr:DNA internalization-related competence protein ComEC/Rec2 [Burkholderiales bacterium]
MRLLVLSFAAGILWLQHQGDLPDVAVLVVAAAVAAIAAALGRRVRFAGVALALLAAALAGAAWAGWRAQERLADALPIGNEGRDIEITGVVAGLPQVIERGLRFDFDVEQSGATVPAHISLAWYRGWQAQDDDDLHAAPEIRAGERWRLLVRLKRPHSNVNPHGFDYEAWLFERDIRAAGYVRKSERNARLDERVDRPAYWVERLRQSVRDRFQRILGDVPYAGILVALAVGDQQSIESGYWRTFARTGVTHLLSVSGLHVTMVAGLVAWLAGWGWRRVPALALRLPTQKAMAAAGMLAAFAYALLAGFEVPAQRTLYMLIVVALAVWSGRNFSSSRVLSVALAIVLALDPWAVLAVGFWLSFGAVGLLFYIGTGRLGKEHWLAAWGRAQWAVTLGMIPALLALFQQFSLVSPIANAVAIPLVSMVITPLALLGTLPLLGEPLLHLGHWLTDILMQLLQWLATSRWAVWQQQAPPAWTVGLALFGIGWLVLPRGFPSRWLGAVALAPLILIPAPRPAEGEALVRMLDIGQGLAVHIQTAQHDMLYDTGPMYSLDADAGDRLIIPYLRAVGVRRLDMLMVSHQDNDHAGGAGVVLTVLPATVLSSSLPNYHPLNTIAPSSHRCQDGDRWQWDGVSFEVLYPAAGDYEAKGTTNSRSCVLKISTPTDSILLTGDIEAKTEAKLLARHGSEIAAAVVLPPHHGSRTSSSAAFIQGVSPRLALISTGYRNRFGHPATEVVERYTQAGVEMRRTDLEGALSIRLTAGGVAVETERQRRPRYWHGA